MKAYKRRTGERVLAERVTAGNIHDLARLVGGTVEPYVTLRHRGEGYAVFLGQWMLIDNGRYAGVCRDAGGGPEDLDPVDEPGAPGDAIPDPPADPDPPPPDPIRPRFGPGDRVRLPDGGVLRITHVDGPAGQYQHDRGCAAIAWLDAQAVPFEPEAPTPDLLPTGWMLLDWVDPRVRQGAMNKCFDDTWAMNVPGGVLVRVSTEALCFVPGVVVRAGDLGGTLAPDPQRSERGGTWEGRGAR